MDWKKTTFLISAYDDKSRLPHLPEMAVLGRSNVGKSTLLNAIFESKSLVKTSSTPGKTQAINYFLVDEKLLCADLPGYGYAKVSKELKDEWGKLLNNYVRTHPKIALFLLLIDVRRDVEEEERDLIEIAFSRQIPLLVVLTKCDKFSSNQLRTRLKTLEADPILQGSIIIPHARGSHQQTEWLRKQITMRIS